MVSDAEMRRCWRSPWRLAEVERPVEIAREAGRVWRGFAYELDGQVIWGATGVMLHALLEIIRKEASWLIPA